MPFWAKCSNNQQNTNTELELRRQVKRTLEILGFEPAGGWSTPRVQITPPTPIAEGMTANQLCVTAETWSMGCVHSEPSQHGKEQGDRTRYNAYDRLQYRPMYEDDVSLQIEDASN